MKSRTVGVITVLFNNSFMLHCAQGSLPRVASEWECWAQVGLVDFQPCKYGSVRRD